MFPKIVLALILLPLIELALFIKLGPILGLWLTLGIIISSALFGLVVGQLAGLRALHRIQDTLAKGELPGNAILDGVLILAASICLFLPGFLTSAIGLLLLIPPLRIPVKHLLRKKFEQRLTSSEPTFFGAVPFNMSHGFNNPDTPFHQNVLLHDHLHASQNASYYEDEDGHGEIIDITPSSRDDSDANQPKHEN